MQVTDFLRLLSQIEPSQSASFEQYLTTFPSDVLEVLLGYLGGMLRSTLPEKNFTPSTHFAFNSSWLPCTSTVYHALPQLLRRRFCRVETIVGSTKFETFGFFDFETDTVFSTINIPFVLSSDFRFKLTVSNSDHYSVARILQNPEQYNSSLLHLLLRVLYPDLQEWLAQNLDEQTQFPEKKMCEIEHMTCMLGLDLDFDFDDQLTPKDLLKSARVGKFRRRKKYSRLKKRRRNKIQDRRTESREKKKKRPKKANRVHRRKRLSCT